MADTIIRTVKATREAGVVSTGDHNHVELKTQEVKNSSEIQLQDNVINVGTNMAPIVCNQVQQKTKFAQNVPNEVILQKFVDLQTLTA